MASVSQQVLIAGSSPFPATLTPQAFLNATVTGPNIVATSPMAIGAESSGRTVFALINWNTNAVGGSPLETLTSVTIGGVNAAIVGQKTGDIGAYAAGVGLVSAQVPTGTTAVVVMTFTSGAAFYNTWVETYSCLGLLDAINPTGSFSSLTLSAGGSHSETLAVKSGGAVLSALYVFTAGTVSAAGITLDYNLRTGNFVVSGGSAVPGSDNPSYSVSSSWTAGTGNILTIGASFR